MRGNSRPSLKECLDFLTSDGSPHLQDNEDVDYIILRRHKTRKAYVYFEFVDGDGKDDKEWFEGPAPVLTTVKFLFEMRDETSRGERREVYGRKKWQDAIDYDDLTGEECKGVESPKSSDNDETVVETVQGSVDKEDGASESTDDYVIGESTNTVTRGAADTRRRTSHKIKKRKSESLAQVVDPPNDLYRGMETRSKTR